MSVFTLFKTKSSDTSTADSKKKALNWGKTFFKVGALLPSNVVAPTEETAGYFIPTFYKYGEKAIAIELGKWEASRQRPDGAFSGSDGVPYTFDTAQVIRGFLSTLDEVPEFAEPLRRACDYVESQIDADGKVRTVSFAGWRLSDGSYFSDYAHLYALPPLLQAGRRLSVPRYIDAVERGIRYFRSKPDLVEFKPELGTLSHIFGYMMEALAELGQTDLARKGLASAAAIQRNDGAIPAYPGVNWICSTGMAQLAAAWYRIGDTAPADKAIDYLRSIQTPSGGFYGSYGKNARYFPDKEIGWAVKYFLDCFLLKRECA
jgi:malonyl-CoA O-methyltransferase